MIDDEETNLLLLRRLLQRAGYSRVVTTTDRPRAIRMFVDDRPAHVLLDLHMPRMDGLEVMERLTSSLEDRCATPFLVLTADATEDAKRAALSRGARDFLAKPFSQTELLLRVANLLRWSCTSVCARTGRRTRPQR